MEFIMFNDNEYLSQNMFDLLDHLVEGGRLWAVDLDVDINPNDSDIMVSVLCQDTANGMTKVVTAPFKPCQYTGYGDQDDVQFVRTDSLYKRLHNKAVYWTDVYSIIEPFILSVHPEFCKLGTPTNSMHLNLDKLKINKKQLRKYIATKLEQRPKIEDKPIKVNPFKNQSFAKALACLKHA